MRAFSHTDFLAHVSKTSAQAYMLITVDPDLIDGKRSAAERALNALDDDVLDKLTIECGAVVVFENIDDAVDVFHKIERNMRTMPNVDLFVSIYFEGYNQLNICQNHEVLAMIYNSPQALAA